MNIYIYIYRDLYFNASDIGMEYDYFPSFLGSSLRAWSIGTVNPFVKVMDEEWPRTVKAHGEKVLVIQMPEFPGFRAQGISAGICIWMKGRHQN